jgi:preprotein translocase subunit SecG
MELIVWMVHVLVAVALVGLVLLQHGKGADMGAAFGSGASGSLFGASGSANFLSRMTGVLAAVFFLSSMALTFFSTKETAPAAAPATGQVAPQPAAPAQPDSGADKSGAIPK